MVLVSMQPTSGGQSNSLSVRDEWLPSVVRMLAPRMRQIASVVYRSGGATLKEIHDQVGEDLTVYGLRTLLNRMVKRGIVVRRSSGRHREILYLPAILTEAVRVAALERLIDDSFDGSPEEALGVAMQLMCRRRQPN